MSKQIYWEDVKEGMEIPTLVKHSSTRQLVRYAGVSGDFYEIHYDKDFAISTGLDGVILHGALKQAFLGQLVTDWIGEHGTLRKLGAQYRGMDKPSDTLFCKGRVTKKYVQGGVHLVDCEVWVENQRGENFTPGWATVALPSRSLD